MESKYQYATGRALQKWTKDGHKSNFRETTKDEDGNNLHVHIYHHETFPEGAQAFTVDVRPERDSQTLLERSRVSLTQGRVCRL